MNLEATLDELRRERARIDQAITVLESLNGGAPAAAKTRGGNGKPPKKAGGSRREVASAARPTRRGGLDPAKKAQAIAMLKDGAQPKAIAAATGVLIQTIYNLRHELKHG